MEPSRRSSRTPVPKVPLDYDEPYRKPSPLSKKKPLSPPKETTPTRPGPASRKAKITGSHASQSPKKEAVKIPPKSPEKPKSPVKNKPGPASKKIPEPEEPEEVEESEEPTEMEESTETEEPTKTVVTIKSEETTEPEEAESEAESGEMSPIKRKAEDTGQKEIKKIKTEQTKIISVPAELPLIPEQTQVTVRTQSLSTLPAGMDSNFIPDKTKMTEEACGQCEFCTRKPCRECSRCKRGDPDNCIDRYCMNNRENVNSRVAMRELYLQMLKNKAAQRDQDKQTEVASRQPRKQQMTPKVELNVQRPLNKSPVNVPKFKTADASGNVVELKGHISENVVFVLEEDSEGEMQKGEEDESGMSTEEKIEKIMSSFTDGQPSGKRKSSDSRTPRKKSYSYVYGSSSSARKLRRCGECEGCMMEDCGKCEICLDKPKYGGPGRLKKACGLRKCIMASSSSKRR